MHHKLKDGLSMYYEVHGPVDASETIVFLNGLSQSTVAWTGVMAPLVKKYKVILLDLISQGQSDAASSFRTYDEHADDVVSLLDHLKINKAIIAGISYGGAVTQHIAVNHPSRCRKIILISTFAHKTAHFNAIGDSWVIALKAGGYPLMLDVMLPVVLGEDYFESPLIPIDTLKQMRVSAALTTDNLLNLMKATEVRKDYREDLKKVSIPTMIIHGRKDLLIPVHMAEEIHKAIKESEFRIIENAGHTLNLEAIRTLSDLIEEFSEPV
jgi:3-oxoadipate enol-lactonase